MKGFPLLLALAALGGAPQAVLAAQAAPAGPTPRQLIAELGPRTRAVAGGDWSAQHQAERDTAAQLRQFIAERPGDPGLTARDAQGRTPLMEAAVNGFADVVEALLADASVRAGLNDSDRFGASAWALAQYARPITLITCHPQMYSREHLPLIQPYTRRAGYFEEGGSTRFDRIEARLREAGAKPDMVAAKAAWLAQCPGAEPALRARVQADNELPVTLWAVTAEQLALFNARLAEAPKGLPAALPPGPVIVPPASPDGAAVRWPKVFAPDLQRPPLNDPLRAIECRRLARPTLPPVNWSGEARFRVRAEIQAGMPVVVDVQRVAGDMDRRTELVVQAMLLRTLAGYECPGDHTFEQEFQFRIQ